ncbi:MAG: elongation factor P-like protein YeiP [Gammaproteobacteria bacterium]|nr:elongation factor P-like protein YeiP [Gammaproteobacteria bacterium]
MAKASELKRGDVVEIEDQPHLCRQVEARSPTSRGASTLYKVRFSNLVTGQKYEASYKGDDLLREVECLRRSVQFSYRDGTHYTFMALDDYSQYTLDEEQLEGQTQYMSEGLEGISALLVADAVIAVELPQAVTLTITETAPALKGATASGRTKVALLSTGLEVQVPEYLAPGESIKINTGNGRFISRGS